jgi:hypothetical protein
MCAFLSYQGEGFPRPNVFLLYEDNALHTIPSFCSTDPLETLTTPKAETLNTLRFENLNTPKRKSPQTLNTLKAESLKKLALKKLRLWNGANTIETLRLLPAS